MSPPVICMVCDFFYPNMGGVENHIFLLSQCLMSLGYKVIVITHAYNDRIGVRYMSRYLKVYYIPAIPVYNQVICPTVYFNIPLMRNIFIREEIEIVHCHGAFSTLGLETLVLASVMGLKTVFTDHSLFGFADASAILMNKVLEAALCNISHVICVSYTSKENTYLRANVHPNKISVIPNAVDTKTFTPDPTARMPDVITVVIMSRLEYRKGMDLLAGVLPLICNRHRDVRFLIGGDGAKRSLLDDVCRKHSITEQVIFLGALNHSAVRDVLVQGDIFLNPSLTEAFCVAICEAACCGLQVVTTDVGGIPEVLPNGMAKLCSPTVKALTHGVEYCIDKIRNGHVPDPWEQHSVMDGLYTWQNIALRTEKIKKGDEASPVLKKSSNFSLSTTGLTSQGLRIPGQTSLCRNGVLSTAYNSGPIIVCEWVWPEKYIDRVPQYGFHRKLKFKKN